MSKGLEALKYLKENKRRHWLDNDNSNECLEIVEKELKALEIIKNKECIFKGLSELTQDEYDLLKEVLL